MDPSERVLIVIPALNAVSTIGEIVLASCRIGYPVLVVDDGSTDGTGPRAESSGAFVLMHERNQGKGGALKTAFAHALKHGYDAVVTLDADGQHLPDQVSLFVEEWKTRGADLIIGSRRHLFKGMVGRRRAANLFSAWTISVAAGIRVIDSQSGFRLYSAELLRGVQVVAQGFDAESEIIVRAGRGGFKVAFIPIALGFIDGVHTSHYRPLWDTLKIAFRVVRTTLFR